MVQLRYVDIVPRQKLFEADDINGLHCVIIVLWSRKYIHQLLLWWRLCLYCRT